tara:strand:- start:25788 stop:27119 length:1332 start_codon:yes stop_codon:yes gene_type:complete
VFEELPLEHSLRLALADMALEQPTEVQAAVVPVAISGRDLTVMARTGSGKTHAYLIPIVQRILSGEFRGRSGSLALVLVPTRELARQVLTQCRKLIAKSPLSAQAITGGADYKYQRALLRKEPEILIATPGRLLEHCEKGGVNLKELLILVLDEADRMLDMGFRDDVLAISGRCNPERQVLMLSATLRHAGVAAISDSLLRDPLKIALDEIRAPHADIEHQLVLADSAEHKDALLQALLANPEYGRVLVFANKRITAARLADMLRRHGLRCGSLHGELSTEERKHVVQQFHDDKIQILCASDIAARGLDVQGIKLVVNYDMPRSGEDYLHRTGRTGRAGVSGLALSFVTQPEWNLMIAIQRYLKLDFERRSIEGLKARFSGPKKLKSSGKAVGSKKKAKRPAGEKARSRQRNQKNLGKPRRPPAGDGGGNDGFAPLKKRDTEH